jgi:hypothetical protein
MDPRDYNPRALEMTTVQAVAVDLGSADDETAPGYKPPFMRQTSQRVEAHFERRTSFVRQTSQRMDTHNPCASAVSCSSLCGFGFFGYFMVMLYMAIVLYPEQEWNCPGYTCLFTHAVHPSLSPPPPPRGGERERRRRTYAELRVGVHNKGGLVGGGGGGDIVQN